jgi:2'-5' RNA ligase
MEDNQKRLFFALELETHWPKNLGQGRILDEPHRHLTFVFLGQVDSTKLLANISQIPLPPFSLGPTGKFDRCLFLPKRRPRVVAWHVSWFDEALPLIKYRNTLRDWLRTLELVPDERDFLPHVTIARYPRMLGQWKNNFHQLPLMIKGIHLYESLGYSRYRSHWHLPFIPAIEAVEHTADIAFKVRAESLGQLHLHAEVALAFECPSLLPFFSDTKHKETLEEVVMALNDLVRIADTEIGCPFKAVSFHGEVVKEGDFLTWEMIVDV